MSVKHFDDGNLEYRPIQMTSTAKLQRLERKTQRQREGKVDKVRIISNWISMPNCKENITNFDQGAQWLKELSIRHH